MLAVNWPSGSVDKHVVIRHQGRETIQVAIVYVLVELEGEGLWVQSRRFATISLSGIAPKTSEPSAYPRVIIAAPCRRFTATRPGSVNLHDKTLSELLEESEAVDDLPVPRHLAFRHLVHCLPGESQALSGCR